MPLVLHKNQGGTILLLWRIAESEEELCALVTVDDRRSAHAFASPRRRLEHLAWRAALRTQVPAGEVVYADAGTPSIRGGKLHIGVAHTTALAVVVLSAAKCSVDTERADREFGAVAARFISPCESQLEDACRPEFSAAVWCAKEAMYKYSGRRELDFLRDLQIISSRLAAGEMTGRITGQDVRIYIMRFGEYLVAYIV